MLSISPSTLSTLSQVLLPEYGGHKVDLGDEEAEYVLFQDDDLLGKFDRA